MNQNRAGRAPVQDRSASTALTVQEKRERTLSAVVSMMNREDRLAQLRDLIGGDKAMVERFKAVALHALAQNNSVLQDCTPESIIEAVRESAVLGLEPTGLLGEAWILPYGATAKLQPGYRGYLKLLRNSGMVAALDCQVVYMNDTFELEFGTAPRIRHVPILIGERDGDGNLLRDRGDFRGVYAWVRFHTGELVIEYMTLAEVAGIQKRSPSVRANRSSPWDTDWTEMARKTVIRRLLKRLPLNAMGPQLQLAAVRDEEADRIGEQEPRGTRSLAADAAAAALSGVGRGQEVVEGEATDVTEKVEPAQGAEKAEPAGEPEKVEEASGLCGAQPPEDYRGGTCSQPPHAEGLHRNIERETWS